MGLVHFLEACQLAVTQQYEVAGSEQFDDPCGRGVPDNCIDVLFYQRSEICTAYQVGQLITLPRYVKRVLVGREGDANHDIAL